MAVVSEKMQTPSTLCSAARMEARSVSEFTGRPATFQAAHGVIAVHANEQGIAALARVFEVGDMAQMEDVKTAVGDDEFFAAGADLPPPCRQLVPGDDFVAEIHGDSLPVRPRFANTKKRGLIWFDLL